MSDKLVATIYCLSVTAERFYLLLRLLIRALRKYQKKEMSEQELFELLDIIEELYHRACDHHLYILDRIAEVVAGE